MSARAMQGGIEETVRYLSSPAAAESLRRDPYWPKWDSPWWRMALLWEMGLARRIPAAAAAGLARAMAGHYLDFFPLTDAELPSGKSEISHVLCHCALGTAEQVLRASGVEIREALPWTDGWYARHQLPDGGLNCEKEAYGGSRKSSVISTLPCLEAVLSRFPALSPEDECFLDKGARYLIEHRLVRSRRGELLNPDWLKPCFPRFYEYDVLRGARFLLRWSDLLGRPVPEDALEDARPWLEGRPVRVERYALDKSSYFPEEGGPRRGPATGFRLLKEVSAVGPLSPYIHVRPEKEAAA